MQNGAFLDSRKTSPIGLGLVIAGHVAVLTVIALAPPEAIPRITYIRTIVDSIADTPPPPKTPPPASKAEPQTTPQPGERIVTAGDPAPTFEPPPIPQTQPIGPIVPVAPDPVLLPATIEPGAMARFQPDYPPELIRADIEGSATVRILVGTDGKVRSVEMVSATHPGFFEATKRQALRFWRFRPATRDGVAIESWRTMTVRFTIHN